jgi:hypothetical protein
MAWFGLGPRWARRNVEAARDVVTESRAGMTAAARAVNVDALNRSQARLVGTSESWQVELWEYLETCGEFGLSVTWRSNMISRVRLRAAEVSPGLDEPRVVDDGPAAELVARLFDDVGGQSDALATLSTYLDVPGEGWLVGEVRDGREVWRPYSSDEIRGWGRRYEVVDESSLPGRLIWRDLAADALVVRVWRPHRRFRHLPYSPARAALSAIRELDLVNRHIQAQYLSRLASAGIVILPDELTFPTRPEFNDEADPFVAEWIATAREAVATPGTAAAVVPIPMRVPAEYVDKVQHIDFTLKLDEKIIEKREAARRRLASIVNVPTELLFDAGSINHWGLWQLEESGVKTYLTPDVELIANALTVGYLRPRLRVADEDPRRWIVWYDASEIVMRPDVSENVIKAYDRFEVTGKTLRREIGLDEDDRPTDSEVRDMVLKKLAANPQVGFVALAELTGVELRVAALGPSVSGTNDAEDEASDGDEDESPVDGPPSTREDPPLTPRGATAGERAAFTVLQARSQHVIEFGRAGHRLKHPLLCRPHLFSCPFTHVTYDGVAVHPGTFGDYECNLSTTGELVIGRRTYPSHDAFIVDDARGTNGVAVLN